MNIPQPQSGTLLASYQTAFVNSRQGFCLLEKIATTTTSPPDFRYLLTNPAFEQQVDFHQVVGKTIRQLLPQTDNHILIEYDQVALTERPAQVETYVATLDQWLNVEAFRVADFEPPWIGVLFTDITERKRREANLAFLAEVSQDLALLTDIDQTMNALGQKIAAYLGLSATSFAELYEGTQPDTLTAVISHGWHRADVPSHLGTYRMEEFMTPEVMQLCLAGKAVVIRDVFEDPRTDGLQYAALHIGSFISMPLVRDGQWRFLLVIYRTEPHDWSQDEIELTRELTTRIWTRLERARAEEALRLEARRKDEFMAMLGHELRNPLAAITNTLLVLELTQGQDEGMPYTKGIQMLTRHNQHLTRMVDDLLDMSRIRQGIVRLQWELVNLNQLLQLTVEAAQPLFREQNRQLTLSLPDQPIYVRGDEARLSQVVMNLLTNGAKYTDLQGQVWVRLEPVGDQAILRVGDNGIGLTVEEQMGIFEVFVQGATSLDRPHGGLGLGLSVVKHLVEGHGGQIQAFSPGLGQGSEFVIHLPLLTDLASAVPTRQVDLLPTSGRVLVVDDNADFADTTARLLRSKGFEVYTRYTGAQGLAGAESLKPDALLLDIGMPYLDGYEVCRQIRAQPWGAPMAIVALTGYGRTEDLAAAMAAGFDAHLLKPLNLDELLGVLASCLRKRRGEPT